MTLLIRHWTVCPKCGYRELGKPEIWYHGEAGVICPNCNRLWETQEEFLIRKKIDEIYDKYDPDVSFQPCEGGVRFTIDPEAMRKIDEEIQKKVRVDE